MNSPDISVDDQIVNEGENLTFDIGDGGDDFDSGGKSLNLQLYLR